MTTGGLAGRWLSRHGQRLAYTLIAIWLVVAVVAATVGGFRLHHAVLIERQTLRTEEYAQTLLELQNLTLQAENGVGPRLASRRAAALKAVTVAFRQLAARNPDAGDRLRAAQLAYLDASTQVFGDTRRGAISGTTELRAQRLLTRLEALVGDEVDRQASASHRVNPGAREALILAAFAAGLVVALLVWQFELERRAGRIDRDNASRAEELIRLRGEFVGVVSHELRTPLSSIVGYLELLNDEGLGNLTTEQLSHFAVVQRNAARLQGLVGDLLLVAESERGPLRLELRDVDIASLVDEAVEAARPAAAARRIRLQVEHGAGTVRADGTRLAQMLDNLISNAIKFTPEGGEVTVRAGPRGGQTLFEVSDTGDGISAADRARLFEPFFRTRQAIAQAVPGTGLGLTITKAIVEAHHGRIQIESVANVGTTFRVRIPRGG